jgi:autotransporter-associated beta strand protein
VLSTTPALDTDPLTAAQTSALVQGIDVLAQRLTQIQTSGLFGDEAATLGESIGTLVPIGDHLRTGLAERLASLSGAITVLDVKNAFTKAATDDPVLSISAVTATRETLGDQTRLWFSVPLAGTTALPQYQLSLGQAPSTGATPSLLDDGLKLGDVKTTVSVGYDGTVQFGIDLAPGLATEQGFFLKFDNFDVFARATATGASAVQDVEANFGIMRLGPADLDVSLDTRVRVDLTEGSDGVVALGELDGAALADLGSLFSLSAAGSGVSVRVPFALSLGGLQQTVGSAQEIFIKATDLFDPASLALTLPSLKLADGKTAFDFTKLADITATDLGAFLSDLGRWVPELGRGFDIPLIDTSIAALFGENLLGDLDDLLAGLKDSSGNWSFDTVEEMIDLLAAGVGVPTTTFNLQWNSTTDAVEWRLPLSFTASATEAFDSGSIAPADLPLDVSGRGSATIDLTAAFTITAGVAIRSSAGLTTITASTLLSALNGGSGLTSNALVSGNDLEFRLRDGSTVGFDLNGISGLGTDATPGTATVGDLLTLLNGATTASKLTVKLSGNSLVASDLTTAASKDATFSIVGPSVKVTVGTTDTVQVSLAPVALGLLAPPTTSGSIEGISLESYSARDRIYVKEDTLASLSLKIGGTLEAGASLGPLALSVYAGAVQGGAGVAVKLVDPGTGLADDGRIYLAEMDGGVADLADFAVSAPTLDGIFQLKVRPDTLASSVFGIVDSLYQASPLTTTPSSPDIPYIRMQAGAAGSSWTFSVSPSQKLEQALEGLADFSVDDLPALLDLFATYLTTSGLWDIEIPWDGRTLGDLLGITDVLASLPSFDLSGILGRPSGGTWSPGSFNGLGAAFLTELELALPSLSTLPTFDRLQRLSWTLDDLMVRWEGWVPGTEGFDLAFIGDLRAWSIEANLVFASLPTSTGLGNVRLAFGRLLTLDATKDSAWLAGLSLSGLNLDGLDLGGLDGLGDLIEGLFPSVSGLSVNVTPSLGTAPSGGGKALVFDTTITYTGLSESVSLDALSLGDGTPFAVSGTGSIFIKIDGAVAARFGLNLSTATPFFDTANSSISLEAEIDDGPGVSLTASVGGIAGISLGSSDAGKQLATVSLSNKAGTDAAQFKLTAAGALTADAAFTANLPIYITGLGDPGTGEGLGALALSATLDTALPDPFAVSATFVADVGSPITQLSDIFSAAAFNLDSWVDGVLLFIDGLQVTLQTDLVQGLPLIGDVDLSSDGTLAKLETFFTGLKPFVTTPKALSDELTTRAGALGSGFTATFSFTIGGVAITSASPTWNTNFSGILGVADEFIVDLTFSGSTSTPLGPDRIDFGLDALGLELRGANVSLDAGFTVDLGLGYSRTKGFFLKTDSGSEVTASFGLSLPASGVEMSLGPLFFALADTHAGQDLTAALTLDLPAASTSIAGLPGLIALATPGGTLEADVRVDLTASAFSMSGPGLGLSLALGYGAGGTPDGGAVSFSTLSASDFYFQITDTYIDLGGLLNGPVQEVFASINDLVEPLKPVLDLLTSDIPLVSDLSKLVGGGGVTFLDAIRLFSGSEYESAVTFIETVDQITDTIATLSGIAASGRISLGGLSGNATKLLGGSGDASAFTTTVPVANAIKGILASPTDAAAPASVKNAYTDITKGTLTFPIITSPGEQLFKFLFGGDATLVSWHLPSLNAGFELSQSFPIFPPLFATIFGGVRFATNFTVGYDTFGLRQAMSGETFDAAKLLNGVYLDDHVTSGTDAAEMTFTATIGAGAELNVAVAKAGVKGGVEGVLGANLKDNDDDGRVHLDEFVANLRSGPECIFDFEGALKAFFEAYIKVGFSTPFGFVTLWSDSFKLLDETIVDFNYVTCPPVEPNLFDVVGSFDHDSNAGTAGVNAVVINAGPRAGNVLLGETEDGNEEFTIDYDSATNQIVVIGYDYEERVSAAGIQTIWFDAGLGNDIITVTSKVMIPVWGYGGPGNDRLTGGAAANTLFGDSGSVAGVAGSDKLVGRKGNDSLSGDGGNDIALGYGGADTISGGDGDDQLYGEDEVGDMVAFIAANADFQAGTAGADTILGGGGGDRVVGGDAGDTLYGDAGDDTLDGGAGNDTIEAGEGNDKAYGRDGDDSIWGDDIDGLLTAGGIDVNADLIEGGSGYNEIHGGPGYDTIYAADGDQKATAPSTGTSGGFSSKLYGGDGNDTVYGTLGRDWIEGGFESDYIEAGTGGDEVLGGPGGDAIIVAGGNARIFGGHGNDVIDGGDGDNWIEGGPGDDRIYARQGADTVYGGTTSIGYAYLQQDLASGRSVIAAIHGGFTAVTAEGSCGPEILFHPEVYPDAPFTIQAKIFNDLDADGVRDPGEPDVPATDSWTVRVVDATTLADVLVVTVAGGVLTLPEADGLPAGTYLVVIDSAPASWNPSTAWSSSVASVTLGGAAAAVVPEFPWYKSGRLSGKVVTRDGTQDSATRSVPVYLDTDADGTWDTGEPVSTTGTDGGYSFTGLKPGAYRIGIVDPGICATVAPRGHSVTLVSGGSSTSYDFRVTPTTAPVIEAVLLGKGGSAVTWTPVPDGAAQGNGLPDSSYGLIAFETCISTGSVLATSGATLHTVSSTGALGTAIPLSFLGADPTKTNRFLYQVYNPGGQSSLTAGRYRFTLDDQSVVSNTGKLLDGEWLNPAPTNPIGSRFPSGDGSAGGDFVFDFVIGGTTGLAMMGSGAVTGPASGDATPTGTIQGSVWYHDAAGADLGRTADEPGIDGQIVLLTTAAGTVVATTTTASLDLDGDGVIADSERGAFRFNALPVGDYVVQQMPVYPWVQATPGGVSAGETLYAVSHETASGKNSLWTIDTATLAATKVRDFQTFVARDVAFTDRGTAWFAGTATAVGGLTPSGSGGLWRMNVTTGAVEDVGMVPGGQTLVSLDTLDDATLLGVTVEGEVLRYSIPTRLWESRGPLLTATSQRYYPVGDAAVVSGSEVYVVCLSQKNPTMTSTAAASQVLVRFDPTASGANATVVRELQVSELLVGLERTATGGLVAVGGGQGLYAFAASAVGSVTRVGSLVGSSAFNFGGLAAAPAAVVTDTQRRDFLVTVTGGQTVSVGFGDVPDWEVLEDGDDVIDGGCGTTADILHGDDGNDLPWYVTTIGGNDVIRGRAGDDQIFGGQQGDVIRGEEGNDTITGGDTESNRLDGGDGSDTVTGGAADDVITGGDGGDTLAGGLGDDTIFGDAGDDTISGGYGDDTLVGGGGKDQMAGDDGDDVLYVIDALLGGSFGTNPGALTDTYSGGAGTDTIVVRADIDSTLTNASVTVYGTAHAVASMENALLTGGDSANTIKASGFGGTTTIRGLGGTDTLTGGSSVDTIFGGKGNDSISGNDGSDDLRGEQDNDQIDGGSGTDTIRGGAGSNVLAGGTDSDTFVFSGTFDDAVFENAAGGGNDTLDLSAVVGSLTMVVDTPASGTRISGWSPMLAVQYLGNEIEQVLLAGGDDVVYLKDGISTVARIDAGAGEDTLSYGGYGGSAWSSGVTVNLLTGAATGVTGGIAGFEDLTGGDGGDTLTGDTGANVIFGGDGGDTISGNSGHDQLYGEDGNDQVTGGLGDDMLAGGSGTNTLAGGFGDDTYSFYASGASDTVNEVVGQGTDVLDFAYVSGTGIDATISATIAVTYGTSTVSVPTAAGIDRVRGTAASDRFRVADGAAYAGILDGYATATSAFADMDILDLSAWTAAVTVSYVGALDATFVGSATGTGGVVNLRHVIGGTGNDILRAGALPVWFEGRAGDDTLAGSIQNDLLDGGNDDDTLIGGYGDDTLKGGWGSDTLAGGFGDDTYSFLDLFGTDTIVENAGEGTDAMDFSGVLSALTVRLGSVTVTAPGASATHAGTAIELVVGGSGDDTFVMTSPSVTFPGTLDGGGGSNTLRYDAASPAIVAAVNAGQTPNVGVAIKFGTVAAVPAYTQVDLTVPAASTITDSTVHSGNDRIVKQGAGRLILTLANTHTAGTAVEAGELVVQNVAALGSGGLEIAANAKVTLDVGAASIKLGFIFIKIDGRLDLGRAALTVASGLTPAGVIAALATGRGDGSWNGASGIVSSTAGASVMAGSDRRIGWLENGDGSITLGSTAPGDTNLDGQVDILDASNLFTGGRYDAGTGGTWNAGDFNYDGVVDILDIADFFTANQYDAGPVNQSPTPVRDASTGEPSSGALAFAAYADEAQSRTTTRKRAFAAI